MATELALTHPESKALGSAQPLAEHLSSRLTNLRDWDDFDTLPVLAGADRYAVQAEISNVTRYLAPCNPDEIRIVLAELDVLPRKREGDAEAEFKMATYARALASLPKWTITRAIQEIIETENWFPVPARIREVAGKHLSKALWRKTCLEQWLERATVAPEDYVTPDQAAAILAEFGLKRDPIERARNEALGRMAASGASDGDRSFEAMVGIAKGYQSETEMAETGT